MKSVHEMESEKECDKGGDLSEDKKWGGKEKERRINPLINALGFPFLGLSSWVWFVPMVYGILRRACML